MFLTFKSKKSPMISSDIKLGTRGLRVRVRVGIHTLPEYNGCVTQTATGNCTGSRLSQNKQTLRLSEVKMTFISNTDCSR